MKINVDKKDLSLTAIILAGGKSSRIGSDKNKSLLKLKGECLIDIVRSRLKQVVGGIYSGLKASPSQYNLVVGCDMPFLEVKLLKYMIENINFNDIVVPRYGDGYIEPLCAIYNKRCLDTIERNLAKRNFSVRAIFPPLKVKFIENEEIRRYDPKFYSFFNINYKKDLIEAEKIIN